MLSPHDKNELIRLMQRALGEIIQLPTATPCVDCKLHEAGACLKWQEAIPAETLPLGCDFWIFDPSAPPF